MCKYIFAAVAGLQILCRTIVYKDFPRSRWKLAFLSQAGIIKYLLLINAKWTTSFTGLDDESSVVTLFLTFLCFCAPGNSGRLRVTLLSSRSLNLRVAEAHCGLREAVAMDSSISYAKLTRARSFCRRSLRLSRHWRTAQTTKVIVMNGMQTARYTCSAPAW